MLPSSVRLSALQSHPFPSLLKSSIFLRGVDASSKCLIGRPRKAPQQKCISKETSIDHFKAVPLCSTALYVVLSSKLAVNPVQGQPTTYLRSSASPRCPVHGPRSAQYFPRIPPPRILPPPRNSKNILRLGHFKAACDAWLRAQTQFPHGLRTWSALAFMKIQDFSRPENLEKISGFAASLELGIPVMSNNKLLHKRCRDFRAVAKHYWKCVVSPNWRICLVVSISEQEWNQRSEHTKHLWKPAYCWQGIFMKTTTLVSLFRLGYIFAAKLKGTIVKFNGRIQRARSATCASADSLSE